MPFDFAKLTTMWVESVDKAVAKLARTAKGETFYALAFHGAYAERGRRIDGYVVAAASEEGLRARHGDAADEAGWIAVRWHPPDWSHEELELSGGRTNVTLYGKLSALGREMSLDAWDELHAQHLNAVVAAARELARRAAAGTGGFARLARAEDFVVFVHEPSAQGPALAARSIPKATFARLFPEQRAKALSRAAFKKLPAAERARFLVTRFSEFEEWPTNEDAHELLVGLGRDAVPALIAGLADPDDGWVSAMVLSRIGSPIAEPAVPALLDHVARGTHAGMWSAVALGTLGRIAELVAFARKAKTRSNAIGGLVAARPASYPHLAALLDKAQPDTVALIGDALQPGRNRYAVQPGELDAVLAQVASPHAVIRRDVACALSADSLEAVHARCGASLAAMLADRDAEVRRLAAVNLSFLGRAARVHRPALEKLARDRVKKVAEAAQFALRELG